MKTRILAILAMVLPICLPPALTARAEVESTAPFALVGTDIATNYCYVVVPPFGEWQNRIQGWETLSDKATAVLTVHSAGTPQTLAYTNAAGTTNITISNAAYAFCTNGSELVLYDPAGGIGYRHTAENAGSNFVTVTPEVQTGLLPGALIYKCTAATSFPVGTTNSKSGTTLWIAGKGQPLLIDLDGTAAADIRAVTGDRIKSR